MRPRCLPVLLLGTAMMASCSTARLSAVPVDLTPAEVARARAAAAATLGQPQTASFQDLHGYALADGTTLVCGQMRGVDPTGIDWGFAPIYVRLDADAILRVHIDDTTDSTAPGDFPYNPATIGCTRASEGLARG